MKHASLSSRRSGTYFAVLALICVVAGPSLLSSQENEANPANAASAQPASSSDVIRVPDGKPVATRLTHDLPTATAKVPRHSHRFRTAARDLQRQDRLAPIVRQRRKPHCQEHADVGRVYKEQLLPSIEQATGAAFRQ